MPDRIRSALFAALVLASAVLVATPAPAAAAQKVAIIVGPVGSLSDHYRTWADEVGATATAAGATVAKAYSPDATWANVKAAVDGANVIVYFGHGNGYPNPYGANELTDRSNGWGLNTSSENGDADSWSAGTLVYCGERALLGTLTESDDAPRRDWCGGPGDGGITPAPGFTMVYAQAHYAPGFGERYVETTPVTTLDEAQQRVRHYSTPILQLGGSYFATAYGDADEIVGRVLNQPNTSFGAIFAAGDGFSPSTLTDSAHEDHAASRIWVQQTTISGFHFGEPDFWYAFAGDPNRTPAGASVPMGGPEMQRLSGSDRFATAAAVSAASFSPGVPVAYIATGANFPDALAAGAAAAELGGPVLLVTGSAIPASTAAELARLQPGTIKLIGGAGVVSDGVLDVLRGYATSGVAERIAGANRYATAAAVSADTFAPGVAAAYIATGTNFPDALSGVAAAGVSGAPILLTAPTEITGDTAAELSRLQPGRIVVLGGAGVISDDVASALGAYATSGDVQRLAGSDRYSTSAAVSTGTFAAGDTVFIATGTNFPDALGGGPVAGILPGPLLLVRGSALPAPVAAELQRLDPARIVILGGPAVVTEGVLNQIRWLLAD